MGCDKQSEGHMHPQALCAAERGEPAHLDCFHNIVALNDLQGVFEYTENLCFAYDTNARPPHQVTAA
jgi:hypothetical protein